MSWRNGNRSSVVTVGPRVSAVSRVETGAGVVQTWVRTVPGS